MQSIEKKEYYLKIAEKVFPELKSGRFFASVKGVEHYFSGLISMEVKSIYKSFYDEFDFAFNVHCTFSLCDQKSDVRWIRQEGREHFFMTPVLFVVERAEMDYEPIQVVKRMQKRYLANTLILSGYSYNHYSSSQLKDLMKRSGLNYFLKDELEILFTSKQFDLTEEKNARTYISKFEKLKSFPSRLALTA